jgi:hypothetical protein
MSKWRVVAVDSAILGMLMISGASSQAADILLVSDQAHSTTGGNTRTGNPEADFIAFLQSQGHNVILPTGSGGTSQFRNANGGFAAAQAAIAANNIDLVIFSRVTDSGSYSETDSNPTGVNRTGWNGITTPLLMMAPHLARSSRWRWGNSADIQEPFQTDFNAFPDPNHPFVAGRGTSLLDVATGSVTRLGNATAGNATVIATLSDSADSDTLDDLAILQWDAGEEFYAGSGQFAGGPRVLFPGIRYHESLSATDPVEFDDLSDNAKAMLAQTITAMTVPEPGAAFLAVLGGLSLLRRGQRRGNHCATSIC